MGQIRTARRQPRRLNIIRQRPRRHQATTATRRVQLDHGGQADQDPGPAAPVTAQGQDGRDQKQQSEAVDVAVAGELDHRERG